MRLSVLDQSMIVSGRSPDSSIRETVELAQLCDRLGYHRYWLSEHHNTDSVAGSAPEILLGALAVTTKRIRLGSAGIMLPHYAALKVAEQFRVLEALAPGRIDLGLGRAPGSDPHTAYALNPNAAAAAENFPTMVRDVMAWVRGEALPEGHPHRAIRAQPMGPSKPEIWILGSSDYGAQVAAYFGLPYAYAYFFAEGRGAREAVALYRRNFRPSAICPQPVAALAVFAVAAETEAEAWRLFAPREVWRAYRDRGQFVALPSPEEAAAYPYHPAELARNARLREQAVVGTGEMVLAKLRAIAESHEADEIAVVTATHAPEDRHRSYTLIAEAAGLKAEDVPLAAE